VTEAISADGDIATAHARATKLQQLNVVLEGCFDLLNGDIDDTEWLGQLADLAECDTVACLWWREKLPQTHMASVHGELDDRPRIWVDYLEPALAAAQPRQLQMLRSLSSDSGLLTSDRMVYCLDHSPIRVVFIFSHRQKSPDWTESDRSHLLQVMQIINKPVRTRRHISWLEDVLDLTNQFLDGLPRACIVLTPDGEIFSANHMARKVLDDSKLMSNKDGKLRLADADKNGELYSELEHVLALDKSELPSYTWHRNLSDSATPNSCMVAMHAFPFENWRLESTARDRVLIMVMQLHSEMAIPSAKQLQEFYKLTGAQARVAAELMADLSIEQIAENLHVSVNTVRTHLRAIYNRLGVDNKGHLIARLSKTLTVPKGDSHA